MRVAFAAVAIFAAAAFAHACTIEIAEPPETGFVAVVLSSEGAAEVAPGHRYLLRIRELSGTYDVDETIKVLPNDTIVRTYPVASYAVSVDSVPVACTSRVGNAQQALISTAGNTSVTRFHFICNSLLGITLYADGNHVDDSFVWTVNGPAGWQEFGLADSADTIRIDEIDAGEYTVDLGHISPNCIMTSRGWRRQTVTVDPPLSSVVHFRVRCSDLSQAPEVIHFASSIRDGVSGFYAEVVETKPDDDLAAYAWNVSDCLGSTLTEEMGLMRDQVRYDRTKGADTARVAVVVPIEASITDGLDHVCTAVRFEDLEGNTTRWLEESSNNETGEAPVVGTFDAVVTDGWLRTTLVASDPDEDLAGAFLTIAFEDGTQTSPPDGNPDIRSYNLVGYLPPFDDIPLIPADGTQFRVPDVESVNAYLIDRAGNLMHVFDEDLSR